MKEKTSGGGSVGDGAVRWSTRQASLFYRRQNNKSYPCRRIPSLFSGVEVLTDADLIKKSGESSENMDEKVNTSTKRPSASCDHKSKQRLVIKAKETSRRKAILSSQVDVKRSKFETNLKRKSSNQDIGSRPSKKKPDIMKVVSKGVQKNTDKKRTKVDCKRPQKTEVSNGSARSVASRDSSGKFVSPTRYKVLMTQPCSVPVVPVATASNAGQRQSGTAMVSNKVPSSTEIERVTSNESLLSLVLLNDENLDKSADNRDDHDKNEEIKQLDEEMNRITSSESLVSVVPLIDELRDKGDGNKEDENEEKKPDEEANSVTSSKSLTDKNVDKEAADNNDVQNQVKEPDEELQPGTSSESSVSLVPLTDEDINNSVKYERDQEKQPDEEMNQTTVVVENKGEPVSELTDPIKEAESVSDILSDDSESDLAKHGIGKGDTCNISPHCELQEVFDRTGNNEDINVSSDNSKRMDETKESKPGNIIIKRSARISERRTNFSVQSLLKSEKLGHKRSFVESNEVKMVGSDYSQAYPVSKMLSRDTSNQPDKRELSGTVQTQQNPLKHRSTSTSTKYTQRMSWKLQPPVTPVDKTNIASVGDIVWGKVHGHPWWPGRVLAISGIRNEESNNPWDRDAHVSWFGSNTSSIMRVHGLQLFLPNFAKRHKRNKKGFYRVAVREAQEALEAMPAKE